MAKTLKIIEVNHEGKTYRLQYTRRTAIALDQTGFDPQTLGEYDKVIPNVLGLWHYAFRANHPYIDRNMTDQIYDDLSGNKKELLARLMEMYSDTKESLIDQNAEGNAAWSANWKMETSEDEEPETLQK